MPENPEEKLELLKDELVKKEDAFSTIMKEKDQLKADIGSLEKLVKDRGQILKAYESGLPEIRKQQQKIEDFIRTKGAITSSIIDTGEEDTIKGEIKKVTDEWDAKKKKMEDAKGELDKAEEDLEKAGTTLRGKQDYFDITRARLKGFTENIKKYSKFMDEILKAEIDVEIAQMYYLLNYLLSDDYDANLKAVVKDLDEYTVDLDNAWTDLDAAKDAVKAAEEVRSSKQKTYEEQVKLMAERLTREKEQILAALKGMKVTN